MVWYGNSFAINLWKNLRRGQYRKLNVSKSISVTVRFRLRHIIWQAVCHWDAIGFQGLPNSISALDVLLPCCHHQL